MTFDAPAYLDSAEVTEFDPAHQARRLLVQLADVIESISEMRATLADGATQVGGDVMRCWHPLHPDRVLEVVCEPAAAGETSKMPLLFVLEPEGQVLAPASQHMEAAKKLIARLNPGRSQGHTR